MTDKFSYHTVQGQELSKFKKTVSGGRLTPVSPKNSASASHQLNISNIQPSNSLPNLTKHPRLDSKTFRILSTQNKNDASLLKSSEQLHEQNSYLKLKIQNLNSTLGRQRVRKQVRVKNIKRLHQKLNTEYSQEIMMDSLANKNHLVQGVKHQYYTLKEKYEQKCRELNEVLKQANNIEHAELKIYCEALESDNRVLKGRVAKMLRTEEEMFKEMQFQQHMEIAQIGGVQATQQWLKEQEQNMVALLRVSAKIATLQQRVRDLTVNMEKLTEKNEVQRLLLKQRRHRIIYLESIIKRKQNQLHQIRLKSSKDLKEKNSIINKLNISLQQQQIRIQKVTEALIIKNKKSLQNHKEICQRYLKQRQQQCQGYKREIKRLDLLLLSTNSTHKQSIYSTKFGKNDRDQIKLGKKQINNKEDNTTIDKFTLTFQREMNAQQQISQNSKDQTSQNKDQSSIQVQRHIKRSSIKHSENCIKVKPVKIAQIQDLKRQLRYKFIFHQLQIDTAKEYLSFEREQIQGLPKNEQDWLKTYISLRQLKEKLKKHPFCLLQKQSLLFSRYIIQDCNKDAIYYHQDNQIERIVAKSILRAFVGQYSLPVQKDSKEQISTVLSKKSKHLHAVLFSFAPKGYISYEKFKQLCKSIEVNFSESTSNFIFSRLPFKSNPLQYNYQSLLHCI